MAVGALVLAALAVDSRRRRVDAAGPAPAVSLFTFCVVYTGAMLLSATSVAITPLQTRYLSPLYAPGVLLVFFGLDDLIPPMQLRPGGSRHIRSGAAGWAVLAVLAATVAWAGVYTVRCSGHVVS